MQSPSCYGTDKRRFTENENSSINHNDDDCSREEVNSTTYLIDTAVNTAESAAQGNVFLVNSVVTHVSFG